MTAKPLIEGVVVAEGPEASMVFGAETAHCRILHDSAPRDGLVDPTSRLAFRVKRPRRSRKKPRQGPSALREAASVLERANEQLMAFAAFVAGKVCAGWPHGHKLSPA